MNKIKERDTITNEIALGSAYQKDIATYYTLGCAEGFINCMTYMDKDRREEIIEDIKEQYKEEKDNKQLEYILRIYKDEFKKDINKQELERQQFVKNNIKNIVDLELNTEFNED